jgi:NADH-quinone oxidoreductase subunit G
VILPGAAYTEKSATYVNTEGRVQMTSRCVFPPGEAREDWAILRALSAELGHTLPFDSLAALRRALYSAHPHLARLGQIARSQTGTVEGADLGRLAALGGRVDATPFRSPVTAYYQTNPIARASAVMAECQAIADGRPLKLAAE